MMILKSVFVIAIVAVAMISLMVPDASGKTYVNDAPYEFSIDYPYGWTVNEEAYPTLVSFQDKDYWDTYISIRHFEMSLSYQNYSDNKLANLVYEHLEDGCKESSFAQNGQICSDYVLYDDNTIIQEIDGYRAITITVSKTLQFSGDPVNYPRLQTFTYIFNGYEFWLLYSETNGFKNFENHADSIHETVKSFRLGNNNNFANTTEKRYDCTPINFTSDSVNRNGNLAFTDKPFTLTIDNPNPKTCQYDVRIHNSEKNQSKIIDGNVISKITTSISKGDLNNDMFYKNTNYWLSIRSLDNSFYKFYPLTIDYSSFNSNNYQ